MGVATSKGVPADVRFLLAVGRLAAALLASGFEAAGAYLLLDFLTENGVHLVTKRLVLAHFNLCIIVLTGLSSLEESPVLPLRRISYAAVPRV